MTTIEDKLTYIDGSVANGRLVVAWKPFTVGNVNAAGGELEWEIVDGIVSITLYSNAGALPFGAYYVAKYELENGAVYQEQWVVPNLPVVTLGFDGATGVYTDSSKYYAQISLQFQIFKPTGQSYMDLAVGQSAASASGQAASEAVVKTAMTQALHRLEGILVSADICRPM